VSQSELVALAYGAVLVFVLVYVVIIAAKLVRLERETAELVELAKRPRRQAQVPADESTLLEVSGEA
jgi:type II secretory pathway component PulM